MRSSKYPWAAWLDGRVWLLRAHHDFMCLVSSIQSQAHSAGREAGVAVVTRDLGLGVLVQAYPVGATWRPNLAAINSGKIDKAMENKR
jgi:hypothetical protein